MVHITYSGGMTEQPRESEVSVSTRPDEVCTLPLRTQVANFARDNRWWAAGSAALCVVTFAGGFIHARSEGSQPSAASTGKRPTGTAPALPGAGQAPSPSVTWSTNPNANTSPAPSSGAFNTAPAAGGAALDCVNVRFVRDANNQLVITPVMAGDTTGHQFVTLAVYDTDKRVAKPGISPLTVDQARLLTFMVVETDDTSITAEKAAAGPLGGDFPDGYIFPCPVGPLLQPAP